MSKIIVKGTEINIAKINEEDYICITDMLKAKDGEFFVTDWLRNRNTLEYIGTWESVYNPDFDFNEFSQITNKSGMNHLGIASIAFPALGCGNGGLSWNVVGPLMYQYLHDLEIDIVVYAPYETSQEQLTVGNLQSNIII